MSKMQENNKITFVYCLKWFFNSFIWLFLCLFLIDIISKHYVFNNLELNKEYRIPFIDIFLIFRLVEGNKGAAWGFLSDSYAGQIILCVISYVTCGIIIFYLIRNWNKLSRLVKAILMMILAGDFGNLIDRTFALLPLNTIYKDGVIDFLDISPIIPHFGAIFNFADACLVVGILMLLVYEIVLMIKEKKEEKEND